MSSRCERYEMSKLKGTGASTEKRTERPPHHVLPHLHLQALHRLRLKLSLVSLLYPINLFKHLLDVSLRLERVISPLATASVILRSSAIARRYTSGLSVLGIK